ncbi:MAG TPA: hypothetical protein VG225_14065 [Terracidiphilus sp.]|jgi:hypothetical protein|nr:hypothetical protein [Terracidiphilus sp.]
MVRVLVLAVIGGVGMSQGAAAPAQTAQAAVSSSALHPNNAAAHSPDVPPLPHGKSTILGGAIRTVDPVRDQFVLNIYGEKPLKILFDERTQVFKDGKRIPLRELGAANHASVQTTLDGADVFAISVHILSQSPSGDYQGRVLSYDADNGMLILTAASGRPPFRVLISNQTSFRRLGQLAFSSVASSANDLVPGSLVTVKFAADRKGQGIAQEVSVLAAPGATFIFSGNLTALDLSTGSLVVVDPRTNTSYQIHFDPSRGPSSDLRPGQHVRISADYDGTRYVATDISIE